MPKVSRKPRRKRSVKRSTNVETKSVKLHRMRCTVVKCLRAGTIAWKIGGKGWQVRCDKDRKI